MTAALRLPVHPTVGRPPWPKPRPWYGPPPPPPPLDVDALPPCGGCDLPIRACSCPDLPWLDLLVP